MQSSVAPIDNGRTLSLQGRLLTTAFFYISLFQMVHGCDGLVFFLPVSNVLGSSTLRSSEVPAICDGSFARQYIYLVISLHSSMSRTVETLESLKMDATHRHSSVNLFLCILFVVRSLNL